MTINPSLFCIYIELPWQHTWHVIGSSGGGSDVLRWMVCVRGEGDVSPGHVGDSPGEMSHGWMWCVLSLSRTIQGTSCCCESHYKTKDPTENLFTRVSSNRAQAGHTHTHTHTVPSLVYQASSSVFAACLLLSLSTQLLTSPLSTVTTKPSELYLKVWTKRSDLHFFCCCCCFLWLLSHSLFSYRLFRTVHKYDKRYPKSPFNRRYFKAPGSQSSFSNLASSV